VVLSPSETHPSRKLFSIPFIPTFTITHSLTNKVSNKAKNNRVILYTANPIVNTHLHLNSPAILSGEINPCTVLEKSAALAFPFRQISRA
jgi:hypothetical protein